MRNKLTLNRYQALAQRTSQDDGHDKVDNGILGLIGETGELVDVYKKWQYQSGIDAPVPVEKFAEELGDVLWYMAELAAGLGVRLGEIADMDFDGFDALAAKASRQRTIRSIILGLSGRANRLNRAVRNSATHEIGANIRRMMMGCARLANTLGYDLKTVAQGNIQKLEKRYPDGFDAAISMGRYE